METYTPDFTNDSGEGIKILSRSQFCSFIQTMNLSEVVKLYIDADKENKNTEYAISIRKEGLNDSHLYVIGGYGFLCTVINEDKKDTEADFIANVNRALDSFDISSEIGVVVFPVCIPDFSNRVDSLREEIIQNIRSILIKNNLFEIKLNETIGERAHVLWDGGNGNWHDTNVIAVSISGKGISIDAEDEFGNIGTSLHSQDLDLTFNNLSWLVSIRDKMIEFLKVREITVYPEKNGEKSSEKDKFKGLINQNKILQKREKRFILSTLSKHGKLSLDLTEEEQKNSDNYPVTSTLYARHDTPSIRITSVYCVGESIFADGIESETNEFRREFLIYPEQFSDIMCFIGHVLF